MQINSQETRCPVCNKLIALFEKPTDPRRLIGACDCKGHLREVIEMDNPNYIDEVNILEPGEPASESVLDQPSAFQQKRSKRK
jgi:hypothetical protein